MNEEKKIRWNIANAMTCVYKALEKSKLNIKETKQYVSSIGKLKDLYNLTLIQV